MSGGGSRLCKVASKLSCSLPTGKANRMVDLMSPKVQKIVLSGHAGKGTSTPIEAV